MTKSHLYRMIEICDYDMSGKIRTFLLGNWAFRFEANGQICDKSWLATLFRWLLP